MNFFVCLTSHTIQVWEVKQTKKSILAQQEITANGPLYLKMKVKEGYQCRFYWKEGVKNWAEIKTGGAYYNASYLPLWDRSPRPGLLHQGSELEPAAFSFFTISYQ